MNVRNGAPVRDGKDTSAGKRWRIAAAGTFLQLCLGTVYAWSFFQNPLTQNYGWSNAAVAGVFSTAIFFLGLAAAWGGMKLPHIGPRNLAMSGGALFGTGYLVSAWALSIKSLPLLYLGYGVLGGVGLGLGYVTPVATVVKWFPDKKGLLSGLVIMGFGFGALLMSALIAPVLLYFTGGDLAPVFAVIGVVFLALTMFFGSVLRNPPAGEEEPGIENNGGDQPRRSLPRALASREFVLMWLAFFSLIVAGIALIGFQSPLLQDLFGPVDYPCETREACGAALIGISSVFNGVGRLLWGSLSDKIGRVLSFRLMLGTQIAVFAVLIKVTNPWLFGVLVCYVLLCYGGGFGAMPSYVQEHFGTCLMPFVYGSMLSAWSAGGLVGPLLVAWLKDSYAEDASSYVFLASLGFVLFGFVMVLFLSRESGAGKYDE